MPRRISLLPTGINARVIDLYSVKPLDTATIRRAASETGRILTVEDHWPEGGIGEAVLTTLAEAGIPIAAKLLAVRHMPGSATPTEELADAGIDAAAIVAAAKELSKRSAAEPAMATSASA